MVFLDTKEIECPPAELVYVLISMHVPWTMDDMYVVSSNRALDIH